MSRIHFRTARKPALALFLTLFLAILACPRAGAERLKSQVGYFVEMPSGFQLSSSDGKAKYSFADPNGGMEFDLLGYEPGRFADLESLVKESLAKLGSKGDATAYAYEGRRAVFAELNFKLNDKGKRGYGVFLEGRATPKTIDKDAKPDGAAAKSGGECSYALLAFADEDKFEGYADFILSCLDSFSIDRGALRSPGPVSQFTLAWPPARNKEKKVSLAALGGSEAGPGSVSLPWSAEEAAQEADTVTREYKVLVAYADEPELYKDAWTRFYRMIYRESAARLDRLALEAAKLLPPNDPTEAARRILAWTQGFVYERDLKGSDFVAPLAAAYEARGDCDSRAVVAAIMLERLGVDAILLVSREYSHALLGVDVPGGGQRFSFGGKDYLMGETTAKVSLGMIAADVADRTKWMGIDLGD